MERQRAQNVKINRRPKYLRLLLRLGDMVHRRIKICVRERFPRVLKLIAELLRIFIIYRACGVYSALHKMYITIDKKSQLMLLVSKKFKLLPIFQLIMTVDVSSLTPLSCARA